MIRRSVLSLLGVLLIAAPAAADWLITRAGGRVETRGPWQVRGKLVVFTPAAGPLSSLRLAEVDLEASRKATAEAQAQTAPAPVTPKKKLAVLTDKDFRKPEGSVPAKPAAAELPSAPAGPLAVSSWKRADLTGGDGIEIQGSLHNATDTLVVNAVVEVQLYTEAGDRVGTAPGVLFSPSLQPGGTVDFRAAFPGVFAFSEVRFEAKGLPLDTGPPPADGKPPEPAPP